jgi:predicted ATPase/class 3 adenylate cyclase/HEPN domain-containing protein
VTFVVTDIEGSTRLLRLFGERYVEALEQHRSVLRQAWARHGGQEVDCQGDGSLVAFSRARAALLGCRDAQRALRSATWPPGVTVRVRMGVHTGLAAPVAGHYVAIAVHQTTRIAAAAHGGQVLVSEHTAQLAGDEGPDEPTELVELGRFRVRDFDSPVRLHQLPGPAAPTGGAPTGGAPIGGQLTGPAPTATLAGGFPPPRAMPADRHNVGVPATRLIDRGQDLAAVRALVGEHRLVTVTGTGGVGKTRLVTELAIRTAPDWPDGVWLAECGGVEDAALLPQAVASAIGVRIEGDRDPVEELLAQLRTQRLLLILDSCERHVEATADLVSTLLASCPDLQVLATSTVPLHLPGETRYLLGPLPTDAGVNSVAVALFTERARAVRPDFRLGPEVADSVVAICRQLDGLPLALEIAAARMTVLHPADILSGLGHRFRLLRVNDPTRPSRQRTLEALLEWSFRLLSDDEARALRRLSLLVGPFDLAAATAAVADDDLPADAVPELVWSLVDKSLLVADPVAGGTRYRSLESVRSYARDRLRATEGPAAAAGRLARFCLDRVGPGRGTGRPWVHDVAADLENLRSVLVAVAPSDPVAAQQLATTIARYHLVVQSFRAGITEISALAGHLVAPTPARVGLLTALGDLHARVGEADRAEQLAAEAGALRARVGGPADDEVGVEKLSGDVALLRNRPERAVALAEQALAGGLSARGRARMSNLLGIARATLGDREAVAAFADELRAAQEAQDDVLLAHAHCNTAEMALRTGDWRTAARHQKACLELATALGQVGLIAYAFLATARIVVFDPPHDLDEWELGVELVAKAEHLLGEIGLALYDTDSRVAEEFVLAARRRLGARRYEDAARAGRELSSASAISRAERVLDWVLHRGGRLPVPRRTAPEPHRA